MEQGIHASTACFAGGLPEDSDFDLSEVGFEVPLCPHCGGTGGDPLDDYCTTCEFCGGEGSEWWVA